MENFVQTSEEILHEESIDLPLVFAEEVVHVKRQLNALSDIHKLELLKFIIIA